VAMKCRYAVRQLGCKAPQCLEGVECTPGPPERPMVA